MNRGELLLRVVRVVRVRGVWIGVRMVGADRDRSASVVYPLHEQRPSRIEGAVAA
jgi:acetolactate synthase regulatory subunit